MKNFYFLDSARLSLKELMYGNSPLLLPVMHVVKLLRVRVGFSPDDQPVESVTPFEVEESAVPFDVYERFRQIASELAGLGFGSPVYYTFVDYLRSTTVYWANYLHESGTHVARIHMKVFKSQSKVHTFLFPMFCTQGMDRSFCVTSAGRPDMLSPDSVRVEYRPGVSVQELWRFHQERLRTERVRPAEIGSQDGLRRCVEEWHRRQRDFHIGRGVFQPLREEERKRLAAADELTADPNVNAEDVEVLMQVLGIQQRKTSAASKISLLVVSLVIFILAAKFFNYSGVALIIPILLLHELGHYISMRAFKYQSVSMLFIPLFGAAVTGQHYNVPGWKRALVSLSGPVPGIMLGIAVGAASIYLANNTLFALATMMLIINGFNLLPVLPLDGGWIFHSVLFSRHPYLDTAFRVLTVAGLLGLRAFTGSFFFLIIGISIATSIPMSWRQASIAHKLRKQGVSGDSSDSYTVPIKTAAMILRELKAAQPSQQVPAIQAQNVLSVFQILNTRPPGIPASIGLLALHLGALLVAVGAFFVFQVASPNETAIGRMFSAALGGSRFLYEAGTSREWKGDAYSIAPGERRLTVIAEYKRDSRADKAFDELAPQLPAEAMACTVGPVLLVSLPGNDAEGEKKWAEYLKAGAERVVSDAEARNIWVTFTCLTGSEEAQKSLEGRLEGSFVYLYPFSLIPCWTDEWKSLPSAERFKYESARATYCRLVKVDDKAYEIVYGCEGGKKTLEDANKLVEDGDIEGADRLYEALDRSYRAEKDRLIKVVCADEEADSGMAELFKNYSAVEQELIDAGYYDDEGLSDEPNSKRAALIEGLVDRKNGLSEKMASRAGRAVKKGDPQGILSGFVGSESVITSVTICSFNDIPTGLPLFAEWLHDNGCTQVRFDYSYRGER